jgi:predicted lipid-binding transport protein (Tim44 family)
VAGGVVVHNKGCFLPETPIRKADGTEAAISSIRPGDQLLAFTPEGRVVTATVLSVLTAEADRYCVVEAGGRILKVTAEHPFYVGSGEFRTLEALRVGDAIYVFDGQGLRPQPIEKIETVLAETTVYNLQTDEPNTFFADGVAVHNKGGGGYRGGRSGSGSDDSPHAIVFVMMFFGIIFVIIKAAARSKQSENLDYVYSPSKVARKADKTLKLLQFLARQDQAMAPDALRAQATATFLKLQQCWQAREYAPMQALLMPDLYANHCRQIQGMIRNHEINMIAGIKVDRLDLVNVRYTLKENQREFTALITATATDYYLDDRTRKFLRGDDSPAQFQEFWTFQRRDKAWLLREIEQSRESDALKEDNFFEQFTETGKEQIYGETARQEGAAGPWLEQDVATKEMRIERLLNFLVQTDKIWDRQAMLETTRRVFLEMMTAWESGQIADVPDADLFPELAADLRRQIENNRSDGLTLEFRNLCVRKAELILVRNFTDNTQDEFVVRVRAHAQQVVRRGDRTVRADADVAPFEMFLTFGRLDSRWKLKEIVAPAEAQALVAQENLDQDSNAQQLQWYYQHKRAG